MIKFSLSRKSKVRAMCLLWVYDIFKLIIAYDIMKTYHINPWVFFFLDSVTIPPYIIGWCRLIESLTGRLQAFRTIIIWSAITFFASTAPYLYVAWAGRQSFPGQAWIILFLLMAFPLVNLIRKILAARRRFHNLRNPKTPAKQGNSLS